MSKEKVKAKDMTSRDAVPVLQKMIKKGGFGKRKTRALEIAVRVLRQMEWWTPKTRKPVAKQRKPQAVPHGASAGAIRKVS